MKNYIAEDVYRIVPFASSLKHTKLNAIFVIYLCIRYIGAKKLGAKKDKHKQ